MSEKWIVPCNLRYFDIENHFAQNKEVVWKNSFTMKINDVAYIYVSAPISAIMYRCRIIQDSISDEVLQKNSYAIPQKESHNYFSKKVKYVVMKLEKVYPKSIMEQLSLEKLRLHGLGQVQIQARADRTLSQYLFDIDDALESCIKNGCDTNV